VRDRGVSGSVVGLAFEEAPSEPRPQGSAELSDLVVDHLRKRRTTTASPTPTALLGAPGPEGTPSRLRLGRMSVQETTFDGVPMALLATHRNESLPPNRGADTRVCRVPTHGDTFRHTKSLDTSVETAGLSARATVGSPRIVSTMWLVESGGATVGGGRSCNLAGRRGMGFPGPKGVTRVRAGEAGSLQTDRQSSV
jgi:hypothetical protein